MIALPYILICFIWAFVIRKKKNFEHTFTAFFASFAVTPLFAKFLYSWLNDHELSKLKRETEFEKRQREFREKRIAEINEKYTPQEMLKMAIEYRDEYCGHDVIRQIKFDQFIEELKTMEHW
jgi:hypothetical protein